MKILFYKEETVDCTADPHYVDFETLRGMYRIILKVCSDPIVWAITSVRLELNGEKYVSDSYFPPITEEDLGKAVKGPYAKKHKIEGLYFFADAEVDSKRHLPPGLSGVKEAVRLILKELESRRTPKGELRIGVAWSFTKDHNCSDYIIVGDLSEPIANFSNQDWYMENENYPEHCERLSRVIGIPDAVKPSEQEGW
ncbi:MAG: hypothetical protein ACE5NN_03550 [Candidatus Bathyarchaeia archaeon]